MEIIFGIIVLLLISWIYQGLNPSNEQDNKACIVCNRTDSKYNWTNPDYPDKNFCTKTCLNKFIKNPNYRKPSNHKGLHKKRVYGSVFDIIGLQYMLRQKCSWCERGHDGRSKYEITHDSFPDKVFYSMTCYRNYNSYYKSNPSEEHKVKKSISLFGVSHHRNIGGGSSLISNDDDVINDTNNIPAPSKIENYSKIFIINTLIGKEFMLNKKKCIMQYGHGSAKTIWVIKKGLFGEHIIQAKKLYKHELVEIYKQVYT